MPGTASSGGRNRRSRAAHALTGTGRADRGTKAGAGANESAGPPVGRPHRPPGLLGHARTEWTRMVVRLEAAKTLSTVDDAALYQYCCLFAETEGILVSRRENAALIKALLKVVDRIVAVAADRDPEAALVNVVHATAQILKLKQLDAKHTTQLRQGHMALRQYLVEFGMTPAARTRVQPSAAEGDQQPANPLARFIKPA